MILFKHIAKPLFLFILAFSFGSSESNAQDLSIVTTLKSPTTNSPQTTGTTLTYHTVVSYTGPLGSSVSATVTLNFSGMELQGTMTINAGPSVTQALNTGTKTSNIYTVTGLTNNFGISFDYTCAITPTNSSAINTTTAIPLGFVETGSISDDISVVQTFIKPILAPPVNVEICSEKAVNEALTTDSPYSSYAWTSAPSANTVSVQGPLGRNTIQDIITNTGTANGTVLYTVTPQITSTIIFSDGTTGAVTTTSGDPNTFTVTVLAPSRVTSVSVTGNGVIYSDATAVFTPNSSLPSATYTWYGSMNKTNFIANGVLSESNLSVGTHTFYVTATSPNSCEGPTFAAQVTVLPLPVKVRKDLTPNNDGIEDTWIITDIDQFPKCSIQVFDMWGNEVYSSTGYGNPWAGTFHNNPLPAATYFYIIDLHNGNPPLSGYVAIIK